MPCLVVQGREGVMGTSHPYVHLQPDLLSSAVPGPNLWLAAHARLPSQLCFDSSVGYPLLICFLASRILLHVYFASCPLSFWVAFAPCCHIFMSVFISLQIPLMPFEYRLQRVWGHRHVLRVLWLMELSRAGSFLDWSEMILLHTVVEYLYIFWCTVMSFKNVWKIFYSNFQISLMLS